MSISAHPRSVVVDTAYSVAIADSHTAVVALHTAAVVDLHIAAGPASGSRKPPDPGWPS